MPLDGRVPSRLVGTKSAIAQVPLSFEVNDGQFDPRVRFLARGPGYALLLTSDGARLRLRRSAPAVSAEAVPAALLELNLVGANPGLTVEGQAPLSGKSHYFLGRNPARWRTNVPQYARVKYRNVYPGMDLVFYGNQRALEFDFVVAPGADLGLVQLRFDGADEVRVDSDGALVIRLGDAEIRQAKPIIYQEWGGRRRFVSGRYVARGDRVGFEALAYRPDQTLVIDPVLSYSSFLGGSDLDAGHAVAVDANDNVYLTGQTASTDFPVLNPLQPENAGASDAFVTKLDPAGNLVFSTYLGGSGDENNFNPSVEASGVAVDSAGNVYLAGRTSSPDFPIQNGLLDNFRGEDYDGFVAKLSADGSVLLYSTYLGGEANDSCNGIAVDNVGNIYVTGGTRSDQGFPITVDAFQRFHGGSLDAFVTKLDPTQVGAASLVYSTFLGGIGIDRGTAITVDASGNAYVTGRTDSTDFWALNAFQATYNGGTDAFVTALNASGTALIYSTYLGGSGFDAGGGIVVDAAGNAYVTGETSSLNFPTMNGFQMSNGGSSDAFVAQLDPTGSVLVYGTYLGGSELDRGTGIAVDASRRVTLTGETSGNFPTVNAFQDRPGGGKDAFIARIDPSLPGPSSLLSSSYLGGSLNDVAFGVAVNSAGDAWITGQTASTDFPTVDPIQVAYGGGSFDAFIARISGSTMTTDYAVSAAPASLMVAPGGAAVYTVTVSPVDGFTGSVDLSVTGVPDAAMAGFDQPSAVIDGATPRSWALTVTTTMATPLGSFTLNIVGSSGAQQRAISVTLVVTGDAATADLSITKNGSAKPVEVRSNGLSDQGPSMRFSQSSPDRTNQQNTAVTRPRRRAPGMPIPPVRQARQSA